MRATPAGGTGARRDFAGARQIQCVGNAEEQRCGGVHTDERRIPSTIEVADPHHEDIRPDDAR
jgi:hypothetical protein